MNITIRQLQAFVTVARSGSFTRAAEKLFVSQPALSIMIRQVEDLLGVNLFDRTTRQVHLTPEGEDFLPTAERLLHDFETAISDIRAVAERRRGRVAIAALPSIAIQLLPDIIAQFTQAYPGISVHMRDDNASGVERRVRRNEVDFGVGSVSESDPELAFRPLIRDRFGLVCGRDHPLARGKGPLRWSTLEGHPFLSLGPDTGIRPLLESTAGLPQSVLSPHYEVSNIATLGALLESGLGITALPALAVLKTQHPALVFRELTEPCVERETGLLTRKGRSLSPAAQSLYDRVIESVPHTGTVSTPLSAARGLRRRRAG